MSGGRMQARGGGASRGMARGQVRLRPLVELLDSQGDSMRTLFAKALNLYVSPGTEAVPEREKLDRLKKAIEESLTQAGPPCSS